MTNQINSFLKKFDNYNELLLNEMSKIKICKDTNLVEIYHNYFKTLIQINYHFDKNINIVRFH
jgi:sucrose-6-phosphate hydrolase SacC (GH32 family)